MTLKKCDTRFWNLRTTFLDGDDYYTTPESLSTVMRLMEERDADILRFECECFGKDADRVQGAREWVRMQVTWDRCVPLEALEAIYVKHQLCWNVIFTGYRTAVLKKVASHVPDVHFTCAEDAFLLFLVISFSMTVAAVKTGPLYSYRIGSGVSTGSVSLAKFPDFAKEVRITRWLQSALEAEGRGEAWLRALTSLRRRLLVAAACRLKQLPPDDQRQGFDLLVAEGYVPELVVALRETNPDPASMSAAARGFYGAQSLKPKVRQTRTVGVMYWRYFDGGVERVMSLQIPMLQALGYQVVLMTETVKPELEFPLPPGVKRVILPATYGEGRAQALAEALVRHQIDVVIDHQAAGIDCLWDVLLMKLCGASVVLTRHGMPWGDMQRYPDTNAGVIEFSRPYVYRLADHLVVLSSAFKTYFEAFDCRVSVVPNPPTFDVKKTPAPGASERQGVLWLGRLDDREKNWRDALRVMEKLAVMAPEAPCFIGGSEYDPGSVEEVQRFIREHHLEKMVHWIGRRTDVQQLMSRCRVFLMTSPNEAFSMSLVEAKICGAPVVIYDMPYLEMLQSEAGCKVVRQRDTEADALAAAEILASDELCDHLSRASRESVEAFYRNHDLPTLWRRILGTPAGGAHAEKMSPADASLRQFFELQSDVVLRGPLQEIDRLRREVRVREEQACAAEEARKRRRIHAGRVIKLAILSKVALTHDKRKHYRSKLCKLFA